MTSSRTASEVLAAVALLLAVLQLVWLSAFIDHAGDGPAFAMAFVGLVGTPCCIVAGAVLLIRHVTARTVTFSVAFAAFAGIAAAAVVGGVFVGDDPDDPVWIARVADAFPYAVGGAIAFAAVLLWRVLRRVQPFSRAILVVPIAVLGTLVTAFLELQVPLVWLAALGLVVTLVVLRIVGRRRRAALGS